LGVLYFEPGKNSNQEEFGRLSEMLKPVQIYSSKNLSEYKNYAYLPFSLKEKETGSSIYGVYYPDLEYWYLFDTNFYNWVAMGPYYIFSLFEPTEIEFKGVKYFPYTTIINADSKSGKKFR
jgi:hypothetical protein